MLFSLARYRAGERLKRISQHELAASVEDLEVGGEMKLCATLRLVISARILVAALLVGSFVQSPGGRGCCYLVTQLTLGS